MSVRERCIATSADADYFPALIALLRSLRRTNGNIPVVVFDGGLTKRQAESAARFAEVVPKKPPLELKGRGKFSYIGDTTLLKLETANLDHEKVLYLDADTIVLESLDELFSFPKGMVGVIREENTLKDIFRRQHRRVLMENIGLDWHMRAFNAGLFAIRPAEWRDLLARANKLIDTFGEDVFSKTKDQQLLNIIFSERTYDFPRRYNFSPMYDDESVHNPAVVHYLTECKPWHRDYPAGHFYEEFRANISILDFPEIILTDFRRTFRNEVL